MYVIKRQQLFPEGDPIPYRDPDGVLQLYYSRDDAERVADCLRADRRNKGWRFLVEVQGGGVDPADQAAAEDRDFRV